MSSAVAKPDSSIRIADRMNGISSELTTKPARSWQSIACLPSWSSTNARARSVVSSAVSRRRHQLDQREHRHRVEEVDAR